MLNVHGEHTYLCVDIYYSDKECIEGIHVCLRTYVTVMYVSTCMCVCVCVCVCVRACVCACVCIHTYAYDGSVQNGGIDGRVRHLI